MKTCRNEEPKGSQMKKTRKALFCGILFLGMLSSVFFGCSGNTQYIKPPVTGKIGEILLIIELRYWKSEIGDTIRAIFERPFPMLPQQEKSYSLIHIDYSSFVPVMQKHRNVITVAVSNEYRSQGNNATRFVGSSADSIQRSGRRSARNRRCNQQKSRFDDQHNRTG